MRLVHSMCPFVIRIQHHIDLLHRISKPFLFLFRFHRMSVCVCVSKMLLLTCYTSDIRFVFCSTVVCYLEKRKICTPMCVYWQCHIKQKHIVNYKLNTLECKKTRQLGAIDQNFFFLTKSTKNEGFFKKLVLNFSDFFFPRNYNCKSQLWFAMRKVCLMQSSNFQPHQMKINFVIEIPLIKSIIINSGCNLSQLHLILRLHLIVYLGEPS